MRPYKPVVNLFRLWPIAVFVLLVACDRNIGPDATKEPPGQPQAFTFRDYLRQDLSEGEVKERMASGDLEVDKLYYDEFDNFVIFRKIIRLDSSIDRHRHLMDRSLINLKGESLFLYRTERCQADDLSGSQDTQRLEVTLGSGSYEETLEFHTDGISNHIQISSTIDASINASSLRGSRDFQNMFQYNSEWYGSLAFVVFDKTALYQGLCGRARSD